MKNQARRHCMIVHAHYPLGETRVQREAESLLQHGYEVDVICLRGRRDAAGETFKGVRIYRLPVQRHKHHGLAVQFLEYLAFFLLAMLKVSHLHWRRPYHTIQTHNPPDFLVFAAWLPRLLGARIILDLHDLMPEFYTGGFQRDTHGLAARLIRAQEYVACRFAQRVITVSHHWRQALIERGVAADKISVVMNVADEAIFRAPSGGTRQPHADGGLRLIYHGTVTERYGLDLVLQAMARLRHEAPEIYLTILGAGDHMAALRRMANELDLNDRVTFGKIRPAEELPEIILAADAGIVPYRNDPFTDSLVPTKLMEYAALSLPSIAAATTAILAYFEDTMVEFFTPDSVDDLACCLARLYSDRTRLAQLAQGAKKFKQRYNWSTTRAAYVALVEELSTP